MTVDKKSTMDFEDWEPASDPLAPQKRLLFEVINGAIVDACSQLTLRNCGIKDKRKRIMSYTRYKAREWLLKKKKDRDDVRRFLNLLNFDEKKFYEMMADYIDEWDAKHSYEIPFYLIALYLPRYSNLPIYIQYHLFNVCVQYSMLPIPGIPIHEPRDREEKYYEPGFKFATRSL